MLEPRKNKAPILKARHVPGEPMFRDGLKIAQRLHHAGCKNVGLLAVGRRVDVKAVAFRLAPALAAARDARVAVFMLETAERKAGIYATEADDAAVDVIVIPSLAASTHILRTRERYAHQLVPLEELVRGGDHLDVFDALDAILLVMMAGEATEREILQRCASIEHERVLALLLHPS